MTPRGRVLRRLLARLLSLAQAGKRGPAWLRRNRGHAPLPILALAGLSLAAGACTEPLPPPTVSVAGQLGGLPSAGFARAEAPRGFVFPADSKTGYLSPPAKRWQALLKRAGMADFRIHDLRRSLGSWQAISGASLAIIGKSLGHKSADATLIYARLSMDPVRASVNTATTAMLQAAGVKKTTKQGRAAK